MAYGFTYTLPTITGTHTDFVIVLKTADFPAAAIDGGASSISNGGGNLRIYTDASKTTQLPVDVVRFVAGGTPDAEVHSKTPTAATSGTVFVEADSVATTQPAVTDTYGRNAVWSGAELCLLMESATPVDRTGNNTIAVAGSPTSIAGAFGTALSFAGDDRLSSTDATLRDILTTYDTTVSIVCRRTGYGSNLAAYSWDGSDDFVAYPYDATTPFRTRVYWRDIANIQANTGVDYSSIWLRQTFTTRASNEHEMYANGESLSTNTSTGAAGPFTAFYVGGFGASSQDFNGDIAQVIVWKTARADSWEATESANQSAPSSWGTVGTWSDSGGAGVTVEIPTLDFSYSGTSLALTVNRKATAEPASYSYSGTDLDLTYTPVGGPSYTLATDLDSYQCTGTSIALAAQRVIPAASGAYSYQGAVEEFGFTRRLLAETGSCTYSGTDITIKATRSMLSGSGVFTYAATDVKLTLPSELWQYSGNVTTDWQPLEDCNTSWADQPIMTTTWTKES